MYEELFIKGGVACGEYALSINGLTTYPSQVILMTSVKNLDCINLCYLKYLYSPIINSKDFIDRKHLRNPKILIPTVERSLVDAIYLSNSIDEGILLESLNTYMFSKLFKVNRNLLYQIGYKLYNLSKDSIDYWISESKDYSGA